MKVLSLASVLMVLAAASIVFADDASTNGGTPEAAGKGGLAVDVRSAGTDTAKHVTVNIRRDGSAESGSGAADVVGFPIIDSGQWGDADWKVNGSQVTGTVKNEKGEVEGTFDGTITATGVSGKFTHVDGRVGLWSWDGPLPSGRRIERKGARTP